MLSVALLAACRGPQSALDPHSPEAAALAELWWLMLSGATLLLLGVMALAAYAMYRNPRRRAALNPQALLIGAGLILPSVTLAALLIWGTLVGRSLLSGPADALAIDVVGRQWWWEIRYPEAQVVSANELVVPVGRSVELRLHSEDVIHSLWLPTLAGKTDLIPGKRNRLRFQADRPGVVLGQCAEFCGLLHAHMRLVVRVLPQAEFVAWLRERGDAARAERLSGQAAGTAAFAALRCARCHTLDGARADARGPDLSHYAARTAMPDRARLAAWLIERHPAELRGRFGVQPVPSPEQAGELAALLERLR